jgi:cytochrome c biogenesis protein CcdA
VVASACSVGLAQPNVSRVTAELTPIVESESARPGAAIRLALGVTLPEGFHLQSNAPRDPTLIPTVLWVDPSAGITVKEIVFPPTTDFRLKGAAEPLAVFEREFIIGIAAEVNRGQPPGPVRIPGRLRYQACDDRVCFVPRSADTSWTIRVVSEAAGVALRAHADLFATIAFGTGSPPPTVAPPPPTAPRTAPGGAASSVLARFDEYTILGTAGGYLGVAEFLEFVKNAEAGVTPEGWFDRRGVPSILAIAFIGGVALNLTPCVLPMIPINLAIIGAGAHADRRRRGFWLGTAYGAAMALVYGVLGVVVILTAGTFGGVNASPWFNLALTAIFVALALAMFDVIAIDPSRFSSRIRFDRGSRGTFLLAFGMGAVAALLAGACVAPVVIQVVLFASDLYARGTTIALALPFILGLGMALPWPAAGAGLAALPRPGVWMVRVKHVFGVFILATAAYYGYVAYGLFANRWVDPASVAAGVEEQVKAGWYASLDEGLLAAERQGTPVLIDFWATWCKNCLVMDKTTLADPTVKAALAGYTKIKFQAEDLDASPARELLRRIRAIGLPAYVIARR